MAVEINCVVEGMEKFKAAMERFDSAIQEQVQKFLAGWAEEVKDYAKQLAPVRTGRLQSSIYAKIQDWVAQIGAEATYALFVEFGTRHMQAHPFLYPAIQEHLPRLESLICEAIDQAKAEAGLT